MTRLVEVKGRRAETRSRRAGIRTLAQGVIETTRLLEAKGQRPFAVNGAGTAPLVIKTRGRMPRGADQINGEVPRNA